MNFIYFSNLGLCNDAASLLGTCWFFSHLTANNMDDILARVEMVDIKLRLLLNNLVGNGGKGLLMTFERFYGGKTWSSGCWIIFSLFQMSKNCKVQLWRWEHQICHESCLENPFQQRGRQARCSPCWKAYVCLSHSSSSIATPPTWDLFGELMLQNDLKKTKRIQKNSHRRIKCVCIQANMHVIMLGNHILFTRYLTRLWAFFDGTVTRNTLTLRVCGF